MDLNVLNSWLLGAAGVACAAVAWMFRRQDARIENAERALADFKLHCAESFVTSNTLEKALDNLNKTIGAVFAKLERIEDKLDLKADK
jgi:septal ring factor EnvC (AmiA/AmiB activator)